MSTILVGYRGSGKTTIGRKLADSLWQNFRDTDEAIVKSAAMSIKDIFEKLGESQFRDLESAALHDALRLHDHVISLGGGAVLRDENRQVIKDSHHRVVYLKCEPSVLWQRISADKETAASRPNLTTAGGLEEVERLLAIREPLYREIANAELDVTHLSINEAATRVVKLL